MAEYGKYRDRKVWQRGMDVVEQVHVITRRFPAEERFGPASQLRRAVTSIPVNGAEGNGRATRRDYASFVSIATGSAGELDTGLLIAIRLAYVSEEVARPVFATLERWQGCSARSGLGSCPTLETPLDPIPNP